MTDIVPFLIRCPTCGGFLKKGVNLFGDEDQGAKYWSDGKKTAPNHPESPSVSRCPHCSHFFYPEDAPEIIDERLMNDENLLRNTPWMTGLKSPDEWFEVLNDHAIIDDDREIQLRIGAWQASNDPYRLTQVTSENPAVPRDKELTENMEALLGLLMDRIAEDRLLIAELCRELGRFEEAQTHLIAPFPKGFEPAVQRVSRLASEGKGEVVELEFKHEPF